MQTTTEHSGQRKEKLPFSPFLFLFFLLLYVRGNRVWQPAWVAIAAFAFALLSSFRSPDSIYGGRGAGQGKEREVGKGYVHSFPEKGEGDKKNLGDWLYCSPRSKYIV